MKKSNVNVVLFAIIIIGSILRLVYIFEISKSPFFFTPFGDPEYFDNWAFRIAQGNLMGNDIFFKPPFYAYILAFFYKIFGHSQLIPRLLNTAFDCISTYLLFLIGKKLYNERVGLISAFIGALCGIFVYFSGEILGTSLVVLLSLSFLYCLLIAERSMFKWFMAGLVLSLAIIARPNFLIFIPGLVIYILMKRKNTKIRVKIAIVFLFGSSIFLLLTGIRNYVVGKDFVLVNYSLGVNFFIGNNRNSDGVSAVLPGYGNDWDEYSIAERELEHVLKPGEVSRFWLGKGLNEIREFPGHSGLLLLKKVYLLFNGKEISNNQNIYLYSKRSHIAKFLLFFIGNRRLYFAFPSSLVFALGLTGIIISLQRRMTKAYILIFFVLVYGFSVVIFFVSSRYRMPMFAYIIPFSAYSIFWISKNFKSKKNLIMWSITFAVFLVLCNFDPFGVRMINKALEMYNLGNVYYKKGDFIKAKEFYEKGIEVNASFPGLHLNLGSVYFKESNLERAENEYRTEIRINPNDGKVYNNLALVYEKEGDLEKAIEYGRKATEIMPRFGPAYVTIGRLYVKEQKYDSAFVFLRFANRLKNDDVKALSLLGFVSLKLGRFEQSVDFYTKALKLQNDNSNLHYNIAVAYIALGNLNDSERHLKRALSLEKGFTAAHYNLGLIYLKEGKEKKAKEEFRRVLALNPDFKQAKKMIEKME